MAQRKTKKRVYKLSWSKKKAKRAPRTDKAVNIAPHVYKLLTKIAKDKKRAIKTQLEIIIEEYEGDS